MMTHKIGTVCIGLIIVAALFLLSTPLLHAQQPAETQVFHPETGEPVPAFRGDASLLQNWLETSEQQAQLQNENGLELSSFIPGGTSRTGFIAGDFAYFGDGPSFVAVDLTNPQSPVARGNFAFPGLISEIVVEGDLAFVAVRNPGGGLFILDISDKDNPQLTGSFTPRAGFTVEALGNQAFIGHGTQGFTRVDVSNPQAPEVIQYITAGGSANGMAVDENFLYVAFGAPGFRIYDITSTEETPLLSTTDVGGFVNNLAIVGDVLYVSSAAGFLIYDVSDRTAPVQLGAYTAAGGVFGASVVDGFAYLSGSFGLRILDVSNPASVSVVSASTPNVQSSLDTFSDGNLAVVSSRFFGLNVVDVSTPSAPVLNGLVDNLGFAYKVALENGILYVMDIAGKLTIFDAANPLAPVFLSRIFTTQNSENISVSDGLVYIVDSDGGSGRITLIDARNPAAPQILEVIPTSSQSFGVDVTADRAYTASGFGGLRVYTRDAESGAVSLISTLPTGNNAYYVRQKDDLALIANFGAGLFVADISDEENPVQASAVVTGQLVQSLDFRPGEPFAVLADGNNGLTVVNLTDPTAPVNEGSFSVANNGRDVRIQQDFVYAAAEFFGVRQFEGSNLTSLTEIASFSTIDRVTGLSVEGGLLAAAGAEGGLYLFSIPFSDAPGPDPDPAFVQLIHSAADPAAALVDIFVNDALVESAFPFGAAIPVSPAPSSELQQLRIKLAGTDTVILEDTFEFEANRTYSITVTGVANPADFAQNPGGADISVNLAVSIYPLLVGPADLHAYLLHTVTDAPAVDVYANGTLLIGGLSYGEPSPFTGLNAETAALSLTLAGTETEVARFTADLSVFEGEFVAIQARGFLNPAENQDGAAFELVAVRPSGEVVVFDAVPVSVLPETQLPAELSLSQNYPNPFNPATSIRFSLPQQQDVRLEVFNMQGQRVAVLASGRFAAGTHTVRFDASALASGLYLYRLSTPDASLTRKMMLLK
ncbi:MAG: T9SS type A sorting domain-containing protein [Balneolales bacterium]|nr:T9SS type A sorting domain-containing protein [Balneolales bacterium]